MTNIQKVTEHKLMENIKGMEAQRLPCPPVSDDQPIQLSSLQTIPAASNLSLSPVILQPEQALSQTIYLKALTIPFYQPIQSECLQQNSQLPTNQTSINLESSNVPLILSPLMSSEWTDQPQALAHKQPQTINIVSGLPILSQSSSLCASLGSPGRTKSAGKYLCKHCGRDCLKPSVLEKHMRSHTGERPFPCTTCGIAFKTQSNLYKHRRTQTHVNNARLPSESDCSSPLEENEKITESVESPQITKANDRNCDHNTRAATKQAISESSGVIASEKHLLRTSLPSPSACSLVSESRWMITDTSFNGGANQNEKEATKDPADSLQKSKIQEQRSPTVNRHNQLQRQQATYLDKLWDSRSPDCKLKKCESTDSGYLSRSESVEQQMLSPSPLHSLCKHSTESEGETTTGSMRCTAGSSSKIDLAEKAATTSTLEKKKLEEHISKLISQNKAVVDDSQLDNVRPRKTVLSKQGSIDLPMPYTYKDSFHFDIRSLDTNRKKNLALCSAKSIFTPVEKAKPLFFHSVPTQFSTTIDCVPVTRSNSLPFVESTRRIQEQVDSSKLASFSRMSPNTRLSGLFHGNNFATGTAESPNSHPRALVRQVAVDDLPQSNVIESLSSMEEMKSPKKPGEGANTKGKKSSQRKLKMFSQEKWQVYGDETFKKIYQKMKSNQVAKKQKGNKIADASNLPSDIKETAIHEANTVPDGRSTISKNLVTSPVAISPKINSEESESHSVGSPLSQSASSCESSSMGVMTASYSVHDSERSKLSKTLLDQRCQELHVLKENPSGKSQAVPLSTGGKLKFQFSQTKGQEHCTPLTAANLQRCSDELEEKCLPGDIISASIAENTRERKSFPLAQVAVPLHHSDNGELVQESQKLPSERKKIKVEEKAMLRVSLDPNNAAGRIVELLDHYKIINIAPVLSVNHSVKGEKQAIVAGMNASGSSMECEVAAQHLPRPSSERDCSVHDTGPASVSALSFSEQLRAEVTNECICRSYTFQKVTEKTCSMITERRMSTQCEAMTPTLSRIQPQVFDQVAPHPKRNEFLPKYILKYPKEGNTAGMPLIIAGEEENISGISLPSTSTGSSFPSNNNRSLGTKATDVFLCPLQLELSHPIRTRELKWDLHTNWKPLMAYSPTILETTNITTRVDGKNDQQIARLEMKDAWKGAQNRHKSDDEPPVPEGGGSAVVLSSLAPEKKICLTSMYTGGFLISSDTTGQSSALQIIHSGSSSIISVSSLVERAALCGNTDKEMKERDSDVNSFPGLQGLPSCSVANTRCLCHSTDMLYCHVLCTQQKDVHTLSRLRIVSCAGNPKIPSLTISFPTLNAEPRLTWCCLTKNLPVEQKEKEDSAYISLHTCRNENAILKGSCSLCKLEKTKKAAGEDMTPGPSKMTTAFLQKQQIEKLNFPTPRGDELLENIVEQEKSRETPCKTRELTTHKAKMSCKRRKVKINHKRYKGSCAPKHILLKTSRLSKQHWPTNRAVDMPKKHPSHPHRPGTHKCCGKCPCLPTASQGNDPSLQQEASCNKADKAAFHVTKKIWMKEDVSEPTNEQSCGNHSLPGFSVIPCMPTASYSSAQHCSLDVFSLGKLQKESWSDTPSDHSWPSTGASNFEFIDTSKTHPQQNLRSEVTSPIFAELKADCKNGPYVDPKCQGVVVLKSSDPITGRKKQPTDEELYPLKQQLAPTFHTLCSVSLGSKMLPEPSASSNNLLGLRHVEETSNSIASLECSDRNHSFVQPEDKEGKPSEPGLTAFKKASAPIANCGILSRSYKNLSLEMMNKQTCVEYDDTSSDDEDRLIIEI